MNFVEFYDKRRKALKIRLMQILNVKVGEELTIDTKQQWFIIFRS